MDCMVSPGPCWWWGRRGGIGESPGNFWARTKVYTITMHHYSLSANISPTTTNLWSTGSVVASLLGVVSTLGYIQVKLAGKKRRRKVEELLKLWCLKQHCSTGTNTGIYYRESKTAYCYIIVVSLEHFHHRFVYIYQELKPATYQHQLTCSNANTEFSVAM
jgi:hypothetical protein